MAGLHCLMPNQSAPCGPLCSAFGKDVVEFLLKPDGVVNRNWDGDKPGVLVTFRSMAGEDPWLPPQPVEIELLFFTSVLLLHLAI